jgi:hypothetical protein
VSIEGKNFASFRAFMPAASPALEAMGGLAHEDGTFCRSAATSSRRRLPDLVPGMTGLQLDPSHSIGLSNRSACTPWPSNAQKEN